MMVQVTVMVALQVRHMIRLGKQELRRLRMQVQIKLLESEMVVNHQTPGT